jgi:taurine dioxygenase
MEIRKFDVVGAEVLGADLSRRNDDEQADFLHRGLLDNGFLVIRDQHISPDDHIAFSSRFGQLSVHVLEDFQLPGFPEITCISNKRENGKAIGIADAGRHWHSDQAYERVPAMGSLLHAQEIPPEGGDTLFADMYAALEKMPESLRAKIEGRNAIFNYSREYKRFQDGNSDRKDLTPEQIARTTGAVHPIIRTHPETGRKALYVSEGHTAMVEGMDEEEGEALLQELFEFSARLEFIHRHVWQPHDLIFWDNRCTMHNAIPYDQKFIRHMHRTTVIGDIPS